MRRAGAACALLGLLVGTGAAVAVVGPSPWSSDGILRSLTGTASVARTMTPEEYGAVGDGRADDTEALQAALASLRPGSALRLRPGATYAHSAVLVVTTDDVRIHGRALFLATEEERSAVVLEGDRATLEGVDLAVAATTRRWSSPEQHKLVVRGSGSVVADVRVRGSAAAGIFVEGASDFVLRDILVEDTRADGIHLTAGAEDGRVERVEARGTGDDALAIVSYAGAPPVRRISAEGVVVHGTTWGRGVAVVGGEDIRLRDLHVEDSSAAGLLVATEGDPWHSTDVHRVDAQDVRIVSANRDPEVDHGAVLVVAGRPGSLVSDVQVRDLSISGTRPTASRQVGVLKGDGRVEAIGLGDVLVSGGGTAFGSDVPDAVTRLRWTVRGA